MSRKNAPSTDSSLLNDNIDILIKAEEHMSRSDLKQELGLIRTGEFSAVVFEGARESVEEISTPSLFDRMVRFSLFFLGMMSTDSKPLLAAAGRTDTTPYYTRERDGDVIDELHNVLSGFAVGIFIVFILLSVIFSIPQFSTDQSYRYDTLFRGVSFVMFAGAFFTPLAVRYYRTQFASNTDRDQIMADRIVKAYRETDGDVLAIVGAKHADGVRDYLPENCSVRAVPPDHTLYSRQGVREFLPGIIKTLIVFSGVWVVIGWIGGALISVVLLLSIS